MKQSIRDKLDHLTGRLEEVDLLLSPAARRRATWRSSEALARKG